MTLNDNYALTFVDGELEITERAITVTAVDKSKVYGEADPALTYEITEGSLAFNDAFNGALSREAGEDVGTYAIGQGTLALNYNYALTFVGANFTIVYGTSGLLPPYYAPSEGKGFKIGSTIPLKWQYTDYSGVAVDSAAAAPLVRAIFVEADNSRVNVEEINDPGNSGLRYQDSNMTWQFNWQTKNLSPGLYEIIIKSGLSGQEDVYPILLRR